MKLSELNEEKVGEILTWLARTDEEFANLKVNLENAEILQKRIRARIFLGTEGNVAERNAEVETHEDTQAADDAYIQARLAYEKLKAKRERGEQFVDVWRSLEASRRKMI